MRTRMHTHTHAHMPARTHARTRTHANNARKQHTHARTEYRVRTQQARAHTRTECGPDPLLYPPVRVHARARAACVARTCGCSTLRAYMAL